MGQASCSDPTHADLLAVVEHLVAENRRQAEQIETQAAQIRTLTETVEAQARTIASQAKRIAALDSLSAVAAGDISGCYCGKGGSSAAAACWAAHETAWYAPGMPSTLDVAIAEIAALPPEEQERVANWILELLRDEAAWNERFGASQDALSQLAADARADRDAGNAAEMDFERR